LHQFDIDFVGRIHQADLDQRHIEAPGDQQLGLRESARARPKLIRNGARLDVLICFAQCDPKPLWKFFACSLPVVRYSLEAGPGDAEAMSRENVEVNRGAIRQPSATRCVPLQESRYGKPQEKFWPGTFA
jgi:hypothetical protein